jgi:small subunit ribosomal protein S16
MSVRIRMQRLGRKKRPFYRIVVADREAPRDGRFIELIGTYDPLQDPPAVKIKTERAAYWISQGATPSDTVRSLLSRQGVAGAAEA